MVSSLDGAGRERFQTFSEFTIIGPINHVSVLGQHLLILNSFDIAHELLDCRGGMYSSRPRLVTFSEMYAMLPRSIPRLTNLMKFTLGWDGRPSSFRWTPDHAGGSIAKPFKRNSVLDMSASTLGCNGELYILSSRAWAKPLRSLEITSRGELYHRLIPHTDLTMTAQQTQIQ